MIYIPRAARDRLEDTGRSSRTADRACDGCHRGEWGPERRFEWQIMDFDAEEECDREKQLLQDVGLAVDPETGTLIDRDDYPETPRYPRG